MNEAVKRERPGVRLEMIAYSSYLQPPKRVSLDPGILVDFCPIAQEFARTIDDGGSRQNRQYADALRTWRKAFGGEISIYSYYRKYAWDSLPVLLPYFQQHELRWYASLPVQGISTYCEPGDWFTYELNHYVLAKLAWDPSRNVHEILRTFAASRYGSEADGKWIAAVYGALEDVVRTTCSIPNNPRPDEQAVEAGRERLSAARRAVEELAEKERNPGVKYNLQRLQWMLDYAIGDLEIQELALRGRKSEAQQRARTLQDEIEAHLSDGVFLSRGWRLSLDRLIKRTGAGEKPAGRGTNRD